MEEKDTAFPSSLSYDPDEYHHQLQSKVRSVCEQFASLQLEGVATVFADALEEGIPLSGQRDAGDMHNSSTFIRHVAPGDHYHAVASAVVDVFLSPPVHYRSRVRMGFWRTRLCYALWDKGSLSVPTRSFPLALNTIDAAMPLLLEDIAEHEVLQQRLDAVHFLSSKHTHALVVTLIYGQSPQDEDVWSSSIQSLRTQLREHLSVEVEVIGRWKGAKRCFDRSYVTECYPLSDGRALQYRLVEGSFSNPNPFVCVHTMNWICAVCRIIAARSHPRGESKSKGCNNGGNMLELYCGNGNHTVVLGPFFQHVVGVEIDERLCEAARHNLRVNRVENATIIHSPSAKVCSRILAEKGLVLPFLSSRAESSSSNGDASATYTDAKIQFDSVLVDPPRAGLDANSLALVQRYAHVVYISCNPTALHRDLAALKESHDLRAFAMFDHFPYTSHFECGAFLCHRTYAGMHEA